MSISGPVWHSYALGVQVCYIRFGQNVFLLCEIPHPWSFCIQETRGFWFFLYFVCYPSFGILFEVRVLFLPIVSIVNFFDSKMFNLSILYVLFNDLYWLIVVLLFFPCLPCLLQLLELCFSFYVLHTIEVSKVSPGFDCILSKYTPMHLLVSAAG